MSSSRMNRSFLYGMVFASSTWCFSLYLYWLIQQPSSTPIADLNGPQTNVDEHVKSQEQFVHGK